MSDTRNHVCNTDNFDRTICPEPCGDMHYYCTACGKRQDRCAHDLMSDTRNHTTRDQLAETIRVECFYGGLDEDSAEYARMADALLASDAIAAVRAAAVAETTAAIEAVLNPEGHPNGRDYGRAAVWSDDVRAALSGGRTAPDTPGQGICWCDGPDCGQTPCAEEQPR